MTKAASEKVVASVEMTDGRIVDFPGKRKMQLSCEIDNDGFLDVKADFLNGETRAFTAAPTKLANFAKYGASQKFRDTIAGLDNIEDCVIAIDDLIDTLNKGEWTATRNSSNSYSGASTLQKALMRVYNLTADKAKAFLKDKTQAQKMALRNNAKLLPVIEEIEAEMNKKAKATIDTDSLLDELDNVVGDAEVAPVE